MRRSQKDMKAGLEQVDLVMKAKREEITEHMEGVVGAVDDEKVISDHLLLYANPGPWPITSAKLE